MKRATIACTLMSLCFLASKLLFSSLASPLSDLLGTLLVFLGAALLLWRIPPQKSFRFWEKDTASYLLLFFPFFVTVWALGAATEAIGGCFGLSNEIDTAAPVWELYLCQVVLASFAEELAFRYVFLRYLAPYHRGFALLTCSTVFALMHVQILQLPYAFLAGAMLAALTLLSSSPLPAFLFHLFNNTVHLSAALYGDFILLFTILLCTAVSIVLLCFKNYRQKIYKKCTAVFPSPKKEEKEWMRQGLSSPLSVLCVLLFLFCLLSL